MENYPFIFSNEKKYRFRRHFVFWVCWWVFSSIIYAFSASALRLTYFDRLPVSAIEAFLYLVPHMFLSYSLVYFVVPRLLLKGKYLQSVIAVVSLFFITAAISTGVSLYILVPLRPLILGNGRYAVHLYEINFYLGLLAGLRGGITIGGLAAAIKLSKHWYVKEQRNLQLQKENIASQLQLLKAQVHPHFLFNTLNNIYANTQVAAPAASGMIMSLSQLLRYMLYECNQPLVPLNREITMLKEYIALEQTRYGNELDVHLELPEVENDLVIAPLVLLPFVENCFKHGTSKMLDQPWISLRLSVEGTWLRMKLLNGKPEEPSTEASGIGLANVTKRLQLLYPEKHELIINNEPEVFIVNLRLTLERQVLPTNYLLKNEAVSYA
ncbi:MAG TPA: histidine kinase [Flavisolibacter sp.]|nr:histidine kinase [Flavisolibacter sp.]